MLNDAPQVVGKDERQILGGWQGGGQPDRLIGVIPGFDTLLHRQFTDCELPTRQV